MNYLVFVVSDHLIIVIYRYNCQKIVRETLESCSSLINSRENYHV